MSVTNYYTANGMILGERTGSGSFRGYKSDALGSVLMTTNGTGTQENAYRYKPYGSELAKGGSAGDPGFSWVGGLGYRCSARSHAELYLRKRHYSPTDTRWLASDPLWPKLAAYTYARGVLIYEYCSHVSAPPMPPTTTSDTGYGDEDFDFEECVELCTAARCKSLAKAPMLPEWAACRVGCLNHCDQGTFGGENSPLWPVGGSQGGICRPGGTIYQ